MQKIPVKLAAPGMKLAKAVTRENGMVVIAEGAELSETLISRLEQMNIERIMVQGSPLDLSGDGSSSWDKKAQRLDHLFRRFKNDRWMTRVKGFFKEYFELKAAEQKAAEEAIKLAEEAAQAEAEAARLEAENGNGGE